MQLISVNVGLPREVVWRNMTISTGIFKYPVAGRVRLRKLNLDGDKNVDLAVHGGPDRPVYAYPAEHYEYWKRELGKDDLPWGSFGENFTTTGLLETGVHIGDQFRIGTALLAVSQPRMPCYKLGIRFGDPLMPKRFMDGGTSGFYMTVLEQGEVGAGDPIELVAEDERRITVAKIRDLYLTGDDHDTIRRALEIPTLSADWRDAFTQLVWDDRRP
jgi:MOSC domain-containing protein YiiM